MKAILIVVLTLVIAGCAEKGPMCGGIAGIACPQGYACKLGGDYSDAAGACYKAADYDHYSCTQDSDCVRQPRCCDCGEGKWVNKAYYNETPECGEGALYCKCALQNRVGVCENNRCTSKPAATAPAQ